MIEIRDIFRGGEDAASRGKGMGRGIPLFISSSSDYGVYGGSIISSPSGFRGKAPAKNGFCAFWAQQNTISDRQKHQNDQMHFDQLLELQRILLLNRDKFGTRFRIPDNSASRMTSYFFSGHALEIRDCPKKFGTDGHLTQISFTYSSDLCCLTNFVAVIIIKQESPAVADKPARRLKSGSRVIQGHRKWH